MNYKKNCITYWLPKLRSAGLPIPATILFDMNKIDKNFVSAMRNIFWMKKPTKKQIATLSRFRGLLEMVADKIGYPLFLRTGHTSQKHDWVNTCFVKSQKQLLKNAQTLAEYSIMKDMKGGLPINVWVVRKLLKVNSAFKAFDGMPITREFRYFIKDGKILCRHPYWPKDAFKGMTKDKNWKLKLKQMNELFKNEQEDLDIMAKKIAEEFEGFWSIDFLQDSKNHWYVIDMATGEDSYHWPKCPKGAKLARK